MQAVYRSIVPFSPPRWAQHLPNIPKTRAILARLPTPIHEWSRMPGVPTDFKLSVKRDDLTGSTVTGSKIRKLEFLFADAISKGYEAVITCGSIQTNLGRATVAAARELGLDPYLVLRALPADTETPERLPVVGNQLVNRMVGTSTVLAPNEAYLTHLKPRVEKLAEDIYARAGKKAYYIPMAGPDICGLWGYMEAYREMAEQGVLDDFDDVVHACGSGGLSYGLAIANHLCGSPVRVHAISVANTEAWYHGHLDTELRMLQFPEDVLAQDVLNVTAEHRGAGYGKWTDKELEFVLSVSRKTGVILDPIYGGKAALGLVTMMQKTPERFRGRRVLFLHTGGLLGMYGMQLEEEILARSPERQVVEWMEAPGEPPYIMGEKEDSDIDTGNTAHPK